MTEPKTKFDAVFFVLLGGFFVGLYIVYAAVSEIVMERARDAAGVVIDARVVDTRVLESRRRGRELQVRYAFEVGGTTYTYGDGTGRRDLWATLSPEAFDRANANHVVAVRYERTDPANNEPAQVTGVSTSNRLIGGGAGCLCMVPGLLMLLGMVRGTRGGGMAQSGGKA